MNSLLVPFLLFSIGAYALYTGIDVFPIFLRGAKKGLSATLEILPTLVGLLTAVYMLRASGFIDFAGQILSPIMSILGIPKECTVLALLKPISGGGGLAVGSEIIKAYGPDSYCGRVAAVMLGASEASLYTISIYCGYLGIKNTRYAVPVAIIGDIVAFVASAFFVRIFQ